MNAPLANSTALLAANRTGGKAQRGFTLIEIMVVVGILGIILATGVPRFAGALQKQGMSKALGDLFDACRAAREEAVIKQTKCEMVIHPGDGTIQASGFSGQIPENVTIISVGVNFIEYNQSDEARASFYPNGTSDEFSITLHGENGEIRQVYLDIVTACPEVKDL